MDDTSRTLRTCDRSDDRRHHYDPYRHPAAKTRLCRMCDDLRAHDLTGQLRGFAIPATRPLHANRRFAGVG